MKKIKPPRIVIVAAFTTITVVFWVFYSLYGVLTTTPHLKVPEDILTPINPELDIKTLESLPGRVFFEQKEVDIISSSPTPTPTENVTPTIVLEEPEAATPTATIVPSP